MFEGRTFDTVRSTRREAVLLGISSCTADTLPYLQAAEAWWQPGEYSDLRRSIACRAVCHCSEVARSLLVARQARWNPLPAEYGSAAGQVGGPVRDSTGNSKTRFDRSHMSTWI